MRWIYETKTITQNMIKKVEDFFNVKFPNDFLDVIKIYNGGYPCPSENKIDEYADIIIGITINGKIEVINNLVSFCEEDENYIIAIFKDTENLYNKNVIPIAEDPFGNLFCYEIKDNNSFSIIFLDNELNEKTYICDTFSEFINTWKEYKV